MYDLISFIDNENKYNQLRKQIIIYLTVPEIAVGFQRVAIGDTVNKKHSQKQPFGENIQQVLLSHNGKQEFDQYFSFKFSWVLEACSLHAKFLIIIFTFWEQKPVSGLYL